MSVATANAFALLEADEGIEDVKAMAQRASAPAKAAPAKPAEKKQGTQVPGRRIAMSADLTASRSRSARNCLRLGYLI